MTDHAHIVVMERPDCDLPRRGTVADWLSQHLTEEVETLQHNPHGAVFEQRLRPLPISATEIRRCIETGNSPRYLLPDAVWEFIQVAGLYGAGTKRE